MSNQTLFTVITFKTKVTSAPLSDVLFSFIALVPALIGVYAGALVNRFSSRVANPD